MTKIITKLLLKLCCCYFNKDRDHLAMVNSRD
ncbi:hypothetical protein DJ90_6490 [Paenibacillus macerans]|uniref:Uncharacterized protein n=1 Tax=Paenibacillus macerans TaxID=44252 RepID=A0A090Y806_PAEMA|nr:hypothetical protein DJ90_6490 [Paenibacillus macerans]